VLVHVKTIVIRHLHLVQLVIAVELAEALVLLPVVQIVQVDVIVDVLDVLATQLLLPMNLLIRQ